MPERQRHSRKDKFSGQGIAQPSRSSSEVLHRPANYTAAATAVLYDFY
jgi:hypothetical protein